MSTNYASGAQLTAAVPAAQLTSGGKLSVVVVNGSISSGSGTPISLEVDNPTVGAIQLSPSALAAGTTSPTTITITGATFVPTSAVQVNGVARTTTYVSPTSLTFVATVADQSTAGTLSVTVTNPAPGGGTSPVAGLAVAAPTPTPVIASVTPTSFMAGSPDTVVDLVGTGFTSNSVVQWNGKALTTSYSYSNGGYFLSATVPAADLTTTGTASITVDTPTANPPLSSAVTVNITNSPAPMLSEISPNFGPTNTATAVTLLGTGFTANSIVVVNGQAVATTFIKSTKITCIIPASILALPGNLNVAVNNPAPGGGASAPALFTAYLAIAHNDIVYNAKDGLLYASLLASGFGSGGNTVAGIDPVTGVIMRQIWVGSNPNKLALSTDGKQLFVGLDGAGAVAQVDLTQGAVVNQFSLEEGPGDYVGPHTANYLAAVPESPNSVAVVAANNLLGGPVITIYDSGKPRTNSTPAVGWGPLSFGPSASILYATNNTGTNQTTIEQLTVGPTGITADATLATLSTQSYSVNSIQYDDGRLYLSTGEVLNASTGALLGTFHSSASSSATWPIVSDSALGRAFGETTFHTSGGKVVAFDEATFSSLGNFTMNDVNADPYPTNFKKIVRWGQNGLALSAAPSTYGTVNQIFLFQSPFVENLSASPADLSIALTAPSTATTGIAVSWVAEINNVGPDQAHGTTFTMNLDPSLIINSVTPSHGSCLTGSEFICDLGSLANGASATVTVNATPSTSGTLAGVATISSTSYDPVTTNNQANTSTAVSGGLYSAAPLVSAISPNFVQAGTSDFTLTVTGTGFNEQSTVNLGSTALTTTYVNATQLTAAVTASEIANYGWAAVTVANPTPGGGVSQVQPLTIYELVNVPAKRILFDPYSQLLYATVPSTATNLTGNSVVTINPATGVVGTPVKVGSEPTVMAETTDGNYLYIGLSGDDSLAQFDLLNQSLKTTIPLSVTHGGFTTSVSASSMASMPGSDTTLAIDVPNSVSWGQLGIFDVSGNTGAFRPNFSGIYGEQDDPVFADDSRLYAYNAEGSVNLSRYSVDANGLTLVDSTSLSGLVGGPFQLADGLVYGASGGIANPTTTPPSQIATLQLFDVFNSGSDGDFVDSLATVADPSLEKEFWMMQYGNGSSTDGLMRYDLASYTPEALIEMPASASGTYVVWTMLRWGQDGLALLSFPRIQLVPEEVAEILLLRGPFVTPQLLTMNSAATLTSSSSSSITHGSGNTLLTLTGSNLLPGVAVTWNGSYRTTTWVSSTQTTVAIPASDLTSAGTASLVATNPGASGSNTLQIPIN